MKRRAAIWSALKLAPMPPTRIADLVEKLLERERLYSAAFEADLARMTKVHGAAPMQEALALLGARRADDRWDQQGHALAAARDIRGILQRRKQDPDAFDDATKI
jgi:hypothetical protein